MLVSGSKDGELRLWEPTTGKAIGNPFTVCFSPSSSTYTEELCKVHMVEMYVGRGKDIIYVTCR